jgi:Cof subfamily protein (haloacid dehalogenase superfamily)
MVSIKLIALDMDGTLLDRFGKISAGNQNAIQEALKQGIHVVIATGRSYPDAKRILDQAQLSLPIVGVNGATITLEDGTLLSSTPIPIATVRDLSDFLHREQVYFEIYTNSGTYTTYQELDRLMLEIEQLGSTDEHLKKHYIDLVEQQKQQSRLICLENYQPEFWNHNLDVYKLLAFSFDAKKWETIFDTLHSYPDLAISSSAEHNIEITHIQAQKGIGLKKFADYLRIPLTHTMAIGDNYNDVSMFQAAGVSVAMGNAHEDIKRICTKTTLTNTEDGVAYAIRNYLQL